MNIVENDWNTITATVRRVAGGCFGPETPECESGEFIEPDFDPTRVVLVGLKMAIGDGSRATYFGKIWLDNFTWPGGCDPQYGFENIINAIDRLKQVGANAAAVVVSWFMDTPFSNVILPDEAKTHTDEEIVRTIERLHRDNDEDFHVVLKPHVDVRDDSWRGLINPTDVGAWFESYEAFILHYAELASRHGAEIFAIGTELQTMTNPTRIDRYRWDRLIDKIRAVDMDQGGTTNQSPVFDVCG